MTVVPRIATTSPGSRCTPSATSSAIATSASPSTSTRGPLTRARAAGLSGDRPQPLHVEVGEGAVDERRRWRRRGAAVGASATAPPSSVSLDADASPRAVRSGCRKPRRRLSGSRQQGRTAPCRLLRSSSYAARWAREQGRARASAARQSARPRAARPPLPRPARRASASSASASARACATVRSRVGLRRVRAAGPPRRGRGRAAPRAAARAPVTASGRDRVMGASPP